MSEKPSRQRDRSRTADGPGGRASRDALAPYAATAPFRRLRAPATSQRCAAKRPVLLHGANPVAQRRGGHLNDRELGEIQRLYGITYRRTLGEIIELNTGIDVQDNVFEVAPE